MEIVSIIFIELLDLLSEYKLSSIELIGIELSNAKAISSLGVFNIFDISPYSRLSSHFTYMFFLNF